MVKQDVDNKNIIDMSEFDTVIVHYAEIGVKGNNRSFFENLLKDNIRQKVGKNCSSVRRELGQLVIKLNDGSDPLEVKDALIRVPGVAIFSFAKRMSLDIEKLKKEIIAFLKDKKFESFRINAKRTDKRYPHSSIELNKILGKEVLDCYKKKVDIDHAEMDIKVEISDKHAYISIENIKGVGGMPTDPKNKVVTLISGGFDSPVAAYMMMKRGCQVIFVHFHNQNQMSGSVENKIIDIVKALSKYQIYTKLYIVPFEDMQKEIIMKVHSTLRMLVYRRYMMKIASKIAEEEKAGFLVVGDSVSQVASQTLENLEATYIDSEKHVLSPLIGMNKAEIIDIARKIGTHDISIQPYGDCCSFFLAKHPELRADINGLREAEKEFDEKKLVSDAVKKAKIIKL